METHTQKQESHVTKDCVYVNSLNKLFALAASKIIDGQERRLERVNQLFENTQKSFTETLQFYGEFDTTSTAEFFTRIADFIVEFENARKDNEESRQRAKKRAAAKQRVEKIRKKTTE